MPISFAPHSEPEPSGYVVKSRRPLVCLPFLPFQRRLRSKQLAVIDIPSRHLGAKLDLFHLSGPLRERILRTVFIYLAPVVFVCRADMWRTCAHSHACHSRTPHCQGPVRPNDGQFRQIPGPTLGIYVALNYPAKRKGLTKIWARSGGRIGAGG